MQPLVFAFFVIALTLSLTLAQPLEGEYRAPDGGPPPQTIARAVLWYKDSTSFGRPVQLFLLAGYLYLHPSEIARLNAAGQVGAELGASVARHIAGWLDRRGFPVEMARYDGVFRAWTEDEKAIVGVRIETNPSFYRPEDFRPFREAIVQYCLEQDIIVEVLAVRSGGPNREPVPRQGERPEGSDESTAAYGGESAHGRYPRTLRSKKRAGGEGAACKESLDVRRLFARRPSVEDMDGYEVAACRLVPKQ